MAEQRPTCAATRSAACAAATVGTGSAVEKTWVLPRLTKKSFQRAEQATKPPWQPKALLRVPMWRSTSASTPSISAAPAPLRAGQRRGARWAGSVEWHAPQGQGRASTAILGTACNAHRPLRTPVSTHERPMRVVHRQQEAVLPPQRGQAPKVSKVTVHGEQGVGDD